ncbi:MAG TPA: TIM44-like domain-containing protein [Burkholderiales bacterium]|nr:TIM44-like domain-containing protein [Burkholderiales bacterium]
MKKLLSIIIAVTGLALAADNAEAAKRLGGGGNVGKQRSGITQQQTAPKAPAQQQGQAAPATPAQQPSGMSRWLGPLAGLALGAGLASLFFNNGFAGALAGILMIGLLVAAAIFVMRALRGRSTQQQPLQYATAGAVEPRITTLPGGAGANSVSATTGSATAATSQWPADFDATEFARHAKLNFVRMQEAHDRRDLSAMREFLTPELYREIEAEVRAAGPAAQKIEVVTLDADVLDVTTESDLYVVSVRFSGLIREQPGAEPEPFAEIWHLEKPVNGRSGWLVAGIQQA